MLAGRVLYGAAPVREWNGQFGTLATVTMDRYPLFGMWILVRTVDETNGNWFQKFKISMVLTETFRRKDRIGCREKNGGIQYPVRLSKMHANLQAIGWPASNLAAMGDF